MTDGSGLPTPCTHESVTTYRSSPARSICDQCYKVVQKVWVAVDQSVVTDEFITSIDRNARAFGWEIGHGADISKPVTEMTAGNPFAFRDWRWRAGL